jgi:hypothetical protein
VYPRRIPPHSELGLRGDIDSDVGERETRDRARHAADEPVTVANLIGVLDAPGAGVEDA